MGLHQGRGVGLGGGADASHQSQDPQGLGVLHRRLPRLPVAQALRQASHRQPQPSPGGQRTQNHINGIEGFWSYAKHILYNYLGVSK